VLAIRATRALLIPRCALPDRSASGGASQTEGKGEKTLDCRGGPPGAVNLSLLPSRRWGRVRGSRISSPCQQQLRATDSCNQQPPGVCYRTDRTLKWELPDISGVLLGVRLSFSKRLLEEEQSRRYHTSDDAVCSNCFNDAGLKAFIEDHLEFDTCTICGVTATHAIAAPADEFLEFFLEKIADHYENAEENAPYDDEEGRWFVNTWDMYDLVFDELGDIADYKTLQWLYKHLKDDITYCERDWQILSPGEALTSAWQKFCHAVKHVTRFLFFVNRKDEQDGGPYSVRPGEILEELGKVILECGLIQDVKTGTRIYRARGHETGKPFTKTVDLGPPPVDCAKSAGRMNASGIVVMCASFSHETALAEATGDHSEFSVAEFELLKNLRVVNLTHIPPPPSIFEAGPREELQFLHGFAHDVSRPFTPDKELHVEYTPTQVVSEYLRHRLRDRRGRPIHGLLYTSAEDKGGINLALFISSDEVERVPSKWSRPKDILLKLTRVQEAIKAKPVAQTKA